MFCLFFSPFPLSPPVSNYTKRTATLQRTK
uniref:Uncharacterized protein n=1 Tax=Siphoviridae sp. ct8Cp41 TaxID=2825358 RepID=A0A8S5UB41_9CAUD|nr:MAG TPA: hypothetical protein [Siphoviridae sp. ct8Cp41]